MKHTLPSKKKEAEAHKQFTFVAYTSSRVVTPNTNVQQKLFVQDNSGKIKGTYIEEKNGKQTLKKEFKSQKGFVSLRNKLANKK
jgi:hypothetical protein